MSTASTALGATFSTIIRALFSSTPPSVPARQPPPLAATQLEALRQVAEQVNYNPNTGAFKWRIAGKGRKLLAPAGTTDINGYLKFSTTIYAGTPQVARLDVRGHRLAVYIMSQHGHCPPLTADTRVTLIGERSDCRWDNIVIEY